MEHAAQCLQADKERFLFWIVIIKCFGTVCGVRWLLQSSVAFNISFYYNTQTRVKYISFILAQNINIQER